jgi:uncharacterized protein (DUF302 family)
MGWFEDCSQQAEAKEEMTKQGSPVLKYALAEPYEAAVRAVRSALKRHGLRTALELDVAARIRSELGAGVAPCYVLYVDDPAVLLEAVVFHRGAALLIPQPIAITGDNRHSEVLVRSPVSLNGAVPESVRDPLLDLLRRITHTVEGIAEKQGEHLAIRS